MNDHVKTAVFMVVAAGVVAAAYLTAPSTPDEQQYSDQGELFYPQFTDPLAAATLEVIDFDAESGTAIPFKVQMKDGRWSIPSHYDYPADGEDRLANTAAGVMDLRKDVVQSDRAQDHVPLGVVDPLDDSTPTLTGRGKRVTLRNEGGTVLADFIVGRAVEGKNGFRYVRTPATKRSYAVKMDVDLSSRFADWIETNLLKLDAWEIGEIQINDYSVDEASGRVNAAGLVNLTKDEGGQWQLADVPDGRELDTAAVSRMTSALSQIRITGVRPKPGTLTVNLRTREGLTIDLPTRLSLESKGFFFSRDGRLLSNEGEVRLGTSTGVRYTLRFGEVLYGEGLSVSAGDQEGEEEPGTESEVENRYLFVTAEFDESLLPPCPDPPEPAEPTVPREGDEPGEAEDAAQARYIQDFEAWEARAEAGRAEAAELNDRFAAWYYVISAADFQDIRLNLERLTQPIQQGPDPQ